MKPQSAGQSGFAEFELGYQNWNTMFKAPQTQVGLTLRACRGFDYLWETFPEIPSGTVNFPEVIGVILEEA